MDKNTENKEKNEKIDLEYMLANQLGDFGLYQWIFIPIVCLAAICGAVYNEYVFSVARIPHRCMIEECGETANSPFSPDWLINAVPWIDGSPSSCERYDAIGSNGSIEYCPAELFDNTTVVACDKRVYLGTNSMVNDFNLGCHEWLRSLAGSMSSFGALLSMPLSGYVSDKYGRRIVLVGSIVLMGLVGVLKTFSVNYTMYMVLQVLQTMLGFGYVGAASVLVSEMVGAKQRIFVNGICKSFSSIGQMWLGLLAWRFQHSWRFFILSLNAPIIVYGLFRFVLPESIRWLLSKRKYEELKKEMINIARINGKTINEKTLETFFVDSQSNDLNKTTSLSKLTVYILKSRVLLTRVAIISVFWICSTFVFYGLSINSTTLSGDTYLNYILTSLMQIPGCIIPGFFGKVGRKPKIAISFFLAGFCNAAFVFTPNDMTALRMSFYFLGMSSISAVSSTLFAFSSELYPTECRQTLFNFSSMIGRIGSILAPLTPALGSYWSGTPSTMFAVCGLLSCFLTMLLPETLGTKLPDTLEEAENLGKN